MIDIVKALETEAVVPVSTPTKAGVVRGWAVASHILHQRLPLWLAAAGVEAPALPPVDGFADVPAILTMLRALPLQEAIHCDPATRMLGEQLARDTHLGPLRAVETALAHCRYDPGEEAKLCEVQVELERVFALLATLAVARHGSVEGFDVGPWERATERLAATLA